MFGKSPFGYRKVESDEEKRRERKESSEDNFPTEFDAELLQKHGYKYMSWNLSVDWELTNQSSKLEDWDFDRNSAFTRISGKVHTLVGHYEIETKAGKGFVEGITHFDYIHFPEVEIILTLRLNEDKGSDNNYGLVDRTVTIPEQTLYFDNLEAGKWSEGEVQPTELLLRIDVDKKKYTWDKSDERGFGISYWENWSEI